MLQLANPPTTGHMYGINGFNDGPCVSDYDPWEHADSLGATIVSNMTLPEPMAAAYSHKLDVIFFRADLPEDVERCAIAHELVHFEHKDIGHSDAQETRADRISTLRLIRPRSLSLAMTCTSDLAEVARELRVTEKVMRLYARMARNGTLPQRY